MALLKSMKKGTNMIKFDSIYYLYNMYNKTGKIYRNYLIKYFIGRKHINKA